MLKKLQSIRGQEKHISSTMDRELSHVKVAAIIVVLEWIANQTEWVEDGGGGDKQVTPTLLQQLPFLGSGPASSCDFSVCMFVCDQPIFGSRNNHIQLAPPLN